MKVDLVNRKKWVCKSDVNEKFLKKYGLSFYSVSYVKNFIDNCYVDGEYVKWFITGNSLNKKQVRHTKFVNIIWLYRELVKNNCK